MRVWGAQLLLDQATMKRQREDVQMAWNGGWPGESMNCVQYDRTSSNGSWISRRTKTNHLSESERKTEEREKEKKKREEEREKKKETKQRGRRGQRGPRGSRGKEKEKKKVPLAGVERCCTA